MNIRSLKRALPGLLCTPALALAAGTHDGGHTAGQEAAPMHDSMHGGTQGDAAAIHHASAAGRPGDPAEARRTVDVEMDDHMRFSPAKLTVKAGETIRFLVVNKGKLPHEMVIGTGAELDEHAEWMRKMPGMSHAEPNQVTLAPGQRGRIVWTFDKPGTFAFACLVPGHREAGMVGSVSVQP